MSRTRNRCGLLLNTSTVVENEILSKGSYLYTVNILEKSLVETQEIK